MGLFVGDMADQHAAAQFVQLGADHGSAAPVCARIVELVREAEASGPDRRRWSGAQLRAAVGL